MFKKLKSLFSKKEEIKKEEEEIIIAEGVIIDESDTDVPDTLPADEAGLKDELKVQEQESEKPADTKSEPEIKEDKKAALAPKNEAEPAAKAAPKIEKKPEPKPAPKPEPKPAPPKKEAKKVKPAPPPEPEEEEDEIIELSFDDVEIDRDEYEKYFEYEEFREKGTINWYERLKGGLALTRGQLVGKIESLVKGDVKLDEELLEEIEQVLFEADLGVNTVSGIIEELQEKIDEDETTNVEKIKEVLKSRIERIIHVKSKPLNLEHKPLTVVLIIGVNGVGKTTTIAKLAYKFRQHGKDVIVAAGDTFRAGAIEQLALWAKRLKIECIQHAINADAAAVVFDAIKAAQGRKKDILIIDTAGRLHTKFNLMEELKKVRKVIEREIPGAPHETFLVLDATTGQNAMQQAKAFKDMIDFSGLIITKLDGTAKGGVIIGIADQLNIPVRYIGIGEKMQDLRDFVAEDFVNALFD